jgi:hypothetical protein
MSNSWGFESEKIWLDGLGEYAEKNRVRLSKMSTFAARDFRTHLLKKYIEANDYRKDRWVIEAVKHAKELIRKIKEGLYPVALQSTADPQIEDSGTSVLSSQLLSSSKRKSFEKKYPSLAKQMV